MRRLMTHREEMPDLIDCSDKAEVYWKKRKSKLVVLVILEKSLFWVKKGRFCDLI